MELRIQQTFGQIGIRTENAQLKIKQNLLPKANIDVQLGDMTINEVRSTVDTDWSKVQAEMGLENLTYSRQEVVAWAKEAAVSAIQTYAAEGDYHASVPSSGDHIAAWEKQQSSGKEPEVTLAALPSVGSLQIDFSTRSLQVDSEQPLVSVNSDQETIQISANRAGVDVYVQQKFAVQISAVKGQKIDNQF
jgi:hypothetical protein